MCSTPMSFVQHGHSINLPTINYSYVFARLAAHSQLRNDWCQRYLPGTGGNHCLHVLQCPTFFQMPYDASQRHTDKKLPWAACIELLFTIVEQIWCKIGYRRTQNVGQNRMGKSKVKMVLGAAINLRTRTASRWVEPDAIWRPMLLHRRGQCFSHFSFWA